MSTSAPIRREYDIPIIKPQRVPSVPRELPAPSPERLIPVVEVWPIKVPEKVSR